MNNKIPILYESREKAESILIMLLLKENILVDNDLFDIAKIKVLFDDNIIIKHWEIVSYTKKEVKKHYR